jgi:outer membrane protein OmpA-like peptidoglycan-associated protein
MRILFFCFFLLPLISSSQELLVNGGFEEENICSEYEVNCAPEGWIYTVPSFIYYFRDRQIAHSGEHFVALVAGHAKKPYYRTFVRSKLLCGLRKGKTYRMQFYIKSQHRILDSIGIYFSSYDFLFEKKPYKKIVASAYLANAAQKLQKDIGWQKVVVDYVAKGDEAFVTLGNFSTKDVTGATGIERENYFFVLFDDISFEPLDPNEKLCDNWQQAKEEIYAQNERHEYLVRLMKENKNKPVQTEKVSPTIVQKIDTLVIPDVLFATGSYTLNKQANEMLDTFVRQSMSLLIDSIVVEGHTDSTGSFALNEELSQNRALAVSNYLQPHFAQMIRTRGWASTKPVADNKTPEGRQKNRRVEIYLYIRE